MADKSAWNRAIFSPKNENEEAIAASFSSLQTSWYVMMKKLGDVESSVSNLKNEINSIYTIITNFIGVQKWNEDTSYNANDIVRVSNVIYISQQGSNTNNYPPSNTSSPWDGITAWHDVSISELITFILNNGWTQRQS